MLYSELYGKLIILTQRSDITHVEIGKCINLAKGAITARAKRNTSMKQSEIALIEKHFNVNLSGMIIFEYTFEARNDNSIKNEVQNFGYRLQALQDKTNLSDCDFSKIINFEEDEYLEFKSGDRKPNLKLLNEIKQHFDVSIDWLLYGK